MSFIRVQCVLDAQTALPEDAFTNTWHFDTDSGYLGPDLDGIQLALETFYATLGPAVLNAQLLGNTLTTKFYDLEDPMPRVPIRTDTFTHGATGTSGYPSEVAICLSFQGVKEAGQPQARRRGRVFLGPLQNQVGVLTSNGLRVGSTYRTIIADAAAAINGDLVAGTKWAVYSPTTDISESMADAFHDVVDGWVDDAFDTMRSRGTAATTRTLFTA